MHCTVLSGCSSALQEELRQRAFVALRAYSKERRDIVAAASKARSGRIVGACLRSWHQHAYRQRVIRNGVEALQKRTVARAMSSALYSWRQTSFTQLASAVVHNQARIKVRMFGAWLQRVRGERALLGNFRAKATRRLRCAALTGWRQHTQQKVAVVAAAEAHRSRRLLLSCLKTWRDYRHHEHRCKVLVSTVLRRRANTDMSKALSAWKQHTSALKAQQRKVSTDPANSFYSQFAAEHGSSVCAIQDSNMLYKTK